MGEKILVLEPFLDLLGGSERMAFEVAKGLAKEGWEVHVGYERDGVWKERYLPFAKAFHEIRLSTLSFRRPWELIGTVWRLRGLMRGLGIQVIFTSYNGHLLAAALMERFCGVRSCFHLGLMGSVANTISGRWAVRQISAGVAPTEQAAESWRKIGWPKQTLQVVPNWIDWEDYRNHPTKEEARSRLGILDIGYGISDEKRKAESGNEIKVVGYVGRLVKEKGIEVLLEAWTEVEEKMPGALLLIAGSGTPEYERYLKNRAGERVRFLGAVVDPKPVYVACDLVVIPSLWEETFGLIPLEAVACGALPLVSDRGFLPQIVDDVDRGLIYPAGNPEELSRKIKDWLNQSNKITVEKLRKLHKKKFDNLKGNQNYTMFVADLLKRAYP
jgi:glycosyltransferase involved in cell wall biosynthesis